VTSYDGLERELTAWMVDVATPSVPDYTDDIVRLTAGRRQRPRWTFPERWPFMSVDALERVPTSPLPWRTVGLLAVIAALLISLVVVSIGSQRRAADPFGLAANGLVSYAAVGDIWVVDPTTGSRRAVATGPEQDHDPRWSPDGTRIAFLRDVQGVQQVVIVAAEGGSPALVASRKLGSVDPDAFKWAPDGRTIMTTADVTGFGAIVLIDAADGAVTTLPVDYGNLEPFWRPPDGRELLFVSGWASKPALSLYSLDTGVTRDVPLAVRSGEELRPMGWTPDGARVLLNRESAVDGQPHTYVIDAESGLSVDLPVGFGHVSNAGDRVAGVRGRSDEAICVIDIDGGPCQGYGPGWAQPGGYHFTDLQWSPDDRWIVVKPLDRSQPILLDAVTGERATDADWLKSGADSWRRDAP
jgi:dipeptidyl aminopeptidase/acylaminoacyl peptidase